LTTETYAGQTTTYTYDNCTYGSGNLCQVSTGTVTTTYTYTPTKNVATETKTIDGINYVTSFAYDYQGNITSITYPDNTQVLYGFTTAGNLKTVKKGTTNVINNIDYAPTGSVSKMEYANGTITENTFDPAKLYRLTSKTTKKGTTTLQNIAYTYDKVGNITKIIDSSPSSISKTANYVYDNMYRLTSATITGAGNNANYTQTYTYDEIGNMTSKSDKGAYSYNGNQGTSYATPHAVTSIGTTTYTYDKNGNMTSDGQRTLTWDSKNRLTQVVSPAGTTSYTYSEGSERVKQVNPTSTIIYPNKYYEIDNGKITKHIFAGGENVASIAQYDLPQPAPSAITNLAASTPTFTSMVLTWTAPGNSGTTGTASSYDIRCSTSAITEANFQAASAVQGTKPAPQVAGTVQSMTVTGLTQGTTYYFAIKTISTTQVVSDVSNVVAGTTIAPDTTPPATTTLTASNITTTSVKISWTAPGDDGTVGTAASYDLRYSTSVILDEEDFNQAIQVVGEPIPLVAGTIQSVTVTGLSSGTAYCFSIKTSDEVPNTSTKSNVLNSKTLPDTTLPGVIITISTSDITMTSVKVNWISPGDDGNIGTATSYDLRYSTVAITNSNWATATPITGEPTPLVAGTPQSMVVDGLTPNTTYFFIIKSSDEAQNISPLSNITNGKTLPLPDTTPPAMIPTLAASAPTATSIQLTWISPGDDGNVGKATGYDVRYSTSTITGANFASAQAIQGTPPPPLNAGTSQSMTATGLTQGKKYYFAIKTLDEASNVSAISNVPTSTTIYSDTTPPPAITNLTVSTSTATGIVLTWTSPGNNLNNTGTAAYYDIRYSTLPITASNFTSALAVKGTKPTPQVAGTLQSMTVTGLTPGVKYYFAIRTAKQSPYAFQLFSVISNIASGTTKSR